MIKDEENRKGSDPYEEVTSVETKELRAFNHIGNNIFGAVSRKKTNF